MEKILGIDLGTNSIGLTLREGDIFSWYGVYTFKKGVGEGKTGEFSYASERTKHRSSRRLYNARRYRKWKTLDVLIENDYCPLKEETLKKWRNYKKGIGRVYPIDDIGFQNWIKLDFNGDGVQDFKSPYQLRRLLIREKLDLSIKENRYKIGRALYHIAQRRGFKSNKKQGSNEKNAVYEGSSETGTIGYREYESLLLEHKTIGAAMAFLEDNGIRVRNRYTLRSDYREEVKTILSFQEISDEKLCNSLLLESSNGSIFYQRPLRSQKGLVGKCTLETNKPRCPISHPKFEEYRAWSFINNIKYRLDKKHDFEPIPLDLKLTLYQEKFFQNNRQIYFDEIRKFISANGGGRWELNYGSDMNKISIPTCYVSYKLKKVFGNEWENYSHTIVRKDKNGVPHKVTYTINDIWHILFSFEDEEYLTQLLHENLHLSSNQVTELVKLFDKFPIGYANLSIKAINNILPFLKMGMNYTESVIMAKIPSILGRDVFSLNKDNIIKSIKEEIKQNKYDRQIALIVNNLIFKYYSLDPQERFGWKDNLYKLDEDDKIQVKKSIVEYFGTRTWQSLNSIYQGKIYSDVLEKYQGFFSSFNREHIKAPQLLQQIKDYIKNTFKIPENLLNHLYHPSQISIYSKKEDQRFLASPKTASFKNPMVYKTLYKLRDVINYLIEIGKIDEETRIVVEIARELNDSNKRWAIEKWQRDRELENREFSIAISELILDPKFIGSANPNSSIDLEKFRLWTEQIENYEEILKQIKATKNDVEKYRLWKEQNCMCMYTGRIIKITDLFNNNLVDFEHTIPRSISFDNSLANMTVCYADYNRNIKKNRLPTELPNYEIDCLGCTSIKPRLVPWEKKVNQLRSQKSKVKLLAQNAKSKGEKDDFIRKMHLINMEYSYWKNKLDRFKRTEVPKGFINSQLVDTQIISKYAYHYLKTVFQRVDVVKSSWVVEFRKIFGIQLEGTSKDRSTHTHHAIDAAVLTLIPSSVKRKETLENYYKYEENSFNSSYRIKPFPNFNYKLIDDIETNLFVNNLADKFNTLTPTLKKVRRRGKIVWLRDKDGVIILDKNGRKIPKISTGDSVRGELHEQKFYGKIKIATKDEDGSLLRDIYGNIIYNQVDGKDEIWMVERKPLELINFDSDFIIDKALSEYLKKQLKEGEQKELLKDFQGNVIRRIRCRARSGRGYMQPDNVTIVKDQTYKSKKDYKNFIYANSGDNFMFGLYENEFGKTIVPINVFESSKSVKYYDGKNLNPIFKIKEPIYIGKGKNRKVAQLKHVFMVGQKVLFYENNRDELKDLDKKTLSERLYYVKTLADSKGGRIRFQHHLEARDDHELEKSFPKEKFGQKGRNGFSRFSSGDYAPRLLLSPSNFNFIIEGKDFIFELDGSIIFKY